MLFFIGFSFTSVAVMAVAAEVGAKAMAAVAPAAKPSAAYVWNMQSND